jgi:hypothetical protein
MAFNKDDVGLIMDNLIDIVKLCINNIKIYESNKGEMMKLIESNNNYFYNKYNRLCHNVVEMDNIEPLIEMIKTFHKVQSGKLSFESANTAIANAINGTYIEPVLNSEKLKKEREQKLV